MFKPYTKKLRIRKSSGNFCCDKGPDGPDGVDIGCNTTKVPYEKILANSLKDNDSKEAYLHNCGLIHDYMYSQSIVRTFGGIYIWPVIYSALLKLAQKSTEKINNAEAFFKYCFEFIKESYPHYENVLKKSNGIFLDISTEIAEDLAINTLSILNKEDEEIDNN